MTVGSEEHGARAGRHRSGESDWLRGAWITAVHGIFYLPEGRTGGAEAVEFVRTDGRSVLMTCASDRTLGITAGAWPDLPAWCVPPAQWGRAPLACLPPPPYGGAWTVVGTEERRDEHGEVHEALVRCLDGAFRVVAGDTMLIDFSPH
ncbi:hypothetical protein [uncultured Streptomyces sp.]|uniref:hypothetical protein n=1 Tax=uncultured Streptomyces sp. TaxID=174707 RepID=UPI00260FFCF9|nr:hypothetical protein [uncultured Streptomyces sp.]